MVFLEIEMVEDIAVPYDMLDLESLPLPKVILLNLLHRIGRRKASEEHGYYIAISTLNTISELYQDEDMGAILFSVSLNCTAVKPFKGEILIGIVTRILEDGIVLQSGPMRNILLLQTKMNDYELNMSEEPMFLKVNGMSYMKKGTKVRFKVFDITWVERNKEFNIWATILSDYLGPI